MTVCGGFSCREATELLRDIQCNEWTNEWMNEWMSDWVSEWMSERMSEWMNEWMNEWMRFRSCSEHNRLYFWWTCPKHNIETINHTVKIQFSYISPRHSNWNAVEMHIPLSEFFPVLRKEFEKSRVAGRTARQHVQNKAHVWVREVIAVFQQSYIKNPAGKAQTSARISQKPTMHILQAYLKAQQSGIKYFVTQTKYQNLSLK